MRSGVHVVIALACGACGRLRFDATTDATDGGTIDDSQSVLADARECFGGGLFTVCPTLPLATSRTVSTQVNIDTGASIDCGTYTGTSESLCVVAAQTITVMPGGSLVGSGARPLVLVAETIIVDGVVLVASYRGGSTGAGANPPACVAGTPPIGDSGGPGGSFGGRGGSGGPSVASALATTNVTTLRGGCRGTDGAGSTRGLGGDGGGAVYLIAGTSISVGGTVNASGAGATGAMDTAGGGGGGSGGMIAFDAPMLTIATGAEVFANGGGGGEGAGATNAGFPGSETLSALVAALGGAGGAAAGDGGNGSAGATLDGAPGLNNQEGGGGGGGAGVIKLFSPNSVVTGAVSPQPT